MAQLLVPGSGLTLVHNAQSRSDEVASKINTGLAQIMQLDLSPNLLGDLLKSARHPGGKGVSVQFGKTIVRGLLISY